MTPDERTARRSRAQRKVAIAAVDDFPPGTRMEVQVGRALIAVFNIGGSFYALFGRCPHQSAPLSRGRLQGTVICNADTCWETRWAHDGEVLVCPGHGMEYDVRSGKAFGYDLKLRTYEVLVEDGQVLLVL
ncbi:MAG: Rieske (2Fe-2S) protein [Caldilineaceae bacterium]|uniref:Rieske (2Fe-2S) protein n=1 Tax=Caldilineaceae bacterium SB0675_bin_29 TaxID=2605266 RepID=A0A6B1G6D2_9CHLR|nr:Rieske (2Fe-2S) protein [Caldilineaceae bacterium]MYH63948.1 Rieske (2Fe-2S) protein [Caldilineaceae bacterium SB0675_bin_29]